MNSTFKKIILFFLIFWMCIAVLNADASDRWQDHDSMYASWGHLAFSWFGYKDADYGDVLKTIFEEWWGKTIYVEVITCK